MEYVGTFLHIQEEKDLYHINPSLFLQNFSLG